ncbi:hypothetical protein LCGC14_0494770 [marine sediment metagenome]|uniref:RND efflux pump membrane fusion protein barrel-sandwich domain-containing protein n=1 Tax=marine sediment metagenome TaxID=412755 RepID=A0A0F9USJ1_9ZZZZ|nr:DUF3347 domain-containing protein [Phycisphaerae bacterium]HDZ43499.1 DUF3347 domain-containing protein [Phycisphaerae bacterium]
MAEQQNVIWRYARAIGQQAGLVVVLVVGIGIGILLHAIFSEDVGKAETPVVASTQPSEPGEADEADEAPIQEWTCSMHPEVRRLEPGLCPKCGMKLIPVKPTKAGGLREFSVSEAGKALMDIETVAVERKFVQAEIRMVGEIDYDETRLAYITAWVPGRLDKLYVDYTGVPVQKGDHMVYIYSPELLSAQEELLQAREAVEALVRSDVGIVREMSEATVVASREKLRLLGLAPEQIETLEATGQAEDHLTIYSPVAGIVIHKNAQEGMYVSTGSRIYTLADLSQVWVKLDAYESDLIWVRYGQTVEFTTISHPGETFTGTIAFIDPILTPGTRTVKVRVNAPNAAGKLKPGMFVKAIVRAQVAAGGKVMDPHLAGKWMCRMHPEIVKEGPGVCDICEMPLERTESLGYVGIDPDKTDKPLVILATAVLRTGTRAIVYVEKPDAEEPTFVGREILLGPRAGDYYIVRSGLAEGDRVVRRGNFKIDSALQILAKPSMMSPEGGAAGGHDHGPKKKTAKGPDAKGELPAMFLHRVQAVLSAAEAVHDAIAEEDLAASRRAFEALGDTVRSIDTADLTDLTDHQRMMWNEYAMRLGNDAVEGSEAKMPKELQRVAKSLETNIALLKKTFGLHGEHPFASSRPPVPPEFRQQLGSLFDAYFELQRALAADQVSTKSVKVQQALAGVDMGLLAGDDHTAWMDLASGLEKILSDAAEATEIDTQRLAFSLLSEQMSAIANRFGPGGEGPLFEMRCPMAFNSRGARWLQPEESVRNPYFGAAMPQCGNVVNVIQAQSEPGEKGSEHGRGSH